VRVIGLQPDAALYAGLAHKVALSREFWALSVSEELFPRFFEHPPYFFQWGAWLMQHFGSSEPTARMMGAIPSFVALILLTFFTARVWGWDIAMWTLFVLASTGHFTKYAATSMLEGPLALGVLLCGIGVYGALSLSRNWLRLGAYLWTGVGVSLACAAKGVVGLGAIGGALLAFVSQIFVDNRSLSRFLYVPIYLSFLLAAAALPFAIWFLQTLENPEMIHWLHGYFVDQVLRSATTDRGEFFFKEANNYFYYLKVIVTQLWPWWWTVPLALFWMIKGRRPFCDRPWVLWALVSLSFLSAFLIPLSLVKYKLPHYLHPTYMLMAPLGALSLSQFWARVRGERWTFLSSPYLRWVLLLLVCAFFWLPQNRISSSANRGQEFIVARKEILPLNSKCKILVPKEEMDPYRMAAFSLWYFQGREWKLIENRYRSAIAIPQNAVYWEPKSQKLLVGRECR
jgi:4-amino-4-deoxy-L-arabinose transferase-like glycosyltransferase